MCNPNTTTNSLTNTNTTTTSSSSLQDATKKPEKTNSSANNNLYLDLLSLANPVKPNTILLAEERVTSPTFKEIISEVKSVISLAFPIALTALILYSRSIVSMLFLGRLGDMELAGGSLAIAFANITGYSVLSGLALGMEPLCSQAYGAQRPKLLSLTLHRSVIFLLFCSVPISMLWVNISKILSFLHQDQNISKLSQTYLLFSLPDLVTNSFVHPIRIYLRSQGITRPLTYASLTATVLHLPLNLLLINYFHFGVAGVAFASAISNAVVLVSLLLYIHAPLSCNLSRECFTGWKPLVKLAAPSCVSVCLEWWWYEIMIVLCGLLFNPKAAVASMGILIQTTSFIYVFPSSLGFAVSTRVGNELGAGRPHTAKLSALVALFFAVLTGLLASLFASSMRHTWASMFTADTEILRLTSAALPILGLCELGNCPQTVACGVVRGTARPSTAANVNLGAFYLVGLPVAVGLGFWLALGFCGLWIGLLSAQVCCAGMMMYVVGTTDWSLQANRARLLTSVGPEESGGRGGTHSGDGCEEEMRLVCIVVT